VGITHVVTRMDWYCALIGHLLDRDHADKSLESVLRRLEQRVIALYKAILLYQIKSVCSYYKHQGLVFFRGLANLDKWDGDLQDVETAEKALLDDWHLYDEVEGKKVSHELVELTKNIETQLGDIHRDIHQDIQDLIALQKDNYTDEDVLETDDDL
jgi:hypothetical protein